MTTKPTISISGMGVVSPAGVGVAAFAEALTAGRSLAAVDDRLRLTPICYSCHVPGFDAKAHGVRRAALLDRYTQFALVASRAAMAAAGHCATDQENARIAVVVGSGAGGTGTFEEQILELARGGSEDLSPNVLPAGLVNMAAGQIAIDMKAMGPCFAPCTACASGATAIGLAKRILEQDEADIVIAGGTEAPITRLYVSAFAKMGVLSRSSRPPAEVSRPFDRGRSGFVIGEGAGIVVMERKSDLLARGAQPIADVVGYGASADASHVTSPHPNGRGAVLAMQNALRDAAASPSDVSYMNAHGTSTQANDSTEAHAIFSVFGEGMRVSSCKGVMGHALGAAAALEAICSALCTRDGWIPPTANLVDPDEACMGLDMVACGARREAVPVVMSNSFGFGGQNVALLFARS